MSQAAGQAQQVTEYSNADVTPKTAPELLTTWWGRWVDTYYLFKVEVVAPSQDGFMTVKLVGDAISALPPAHRARQPLEVNLRNGRYCWSDLPSTAQQVVTASDTARFGFLLLTQEWAEAHQLEIQVSTMDDGGGTKWPKGAGGRLRSLPAAVGRTG